jgi:hypothetical protein
MSLPYADDDLIRPLYAIDRATLAQLVRDWGEARATERYIRERQLLNWLDTRWPALIRTLEKEQP